MTYEPGKHRRRSIRLKGYDYSKSGAYFITIVTRNRACLFGKVVNGKIRLNDAGRMVATEWEMIPERFPTVALDAFIVMPNHVHGIIVITNAAIVHDGANGVNDGENNVNDGENNVGATLVVAPYGLTPVPNGTTPVPDRAGTRPAPTVVAPTVGDVVGAFKSRVTVEYIRGIKTSGWTPFHRDLWQRNYYEHVIRNEDALNRIRKYITDNPARWLFDYENPEATILKREKI